MNAFPALFDHLAWADGRALASIRTLDAGHPAHARAMRLYAHLAAAAHVWLSRIEGRAPAHPVWPELPLDEAERLAAESIAGLRRAAEGDDAALARVVEYRTSAGDPFRTPVGEILLQVALHGGHHRGQLALLVRDGGGVPVATDFIVFSRDRRAR